MNPQDRDWLLDADDIIAEHKRRHDEPWEPRCDDCKNGDCTRLNWASGLIDALVFRSAK